MNDKIIFRELLAEIGEWAEEKGNKLTKDEIKSFLKKVSLTDEQMEFVYSYLEANKIDIIGHEKNENMKLFQTNDEKNEETIKEAMDEGDKGENTKKSSYIGAEDNKHLRMYFEELGTLPSMSEQQKLDLYNQVLQGDSLAKSKAIEMHLVTVVEIAKRYENKGISLSDLIQEGNIGLMLALDGIEEPVELNQFEDMLKRGIESAIVGVIEEDDTIKQADRQIISKVNYLNEGAKNLEEELERAVSIEELAKYMEMSEEEVRNIIRVSDDGIKVKENKENNRNNL
jgi:RNA polymerase primary sigma factor